MQCKENPLQHFSLLLAFCFPPGHKRRGAPMGSKSRTEISKKTVCCWKQIFALLVFSQEQSPKSPLCQILGFLSCRRDLLMTCPDVDEGNCINNGVKTH